MRAIRKGLKCRHVFYAQNNLTVCCIALGPTFLTEYVILNGPGSSNLVTGLNDKSSKCAHRPCMNTSESYRSGWVGLMMLVSPSKATPSSRHNPTFFIRSHVRHYRPDREAHVLECTNETQENLGGDGGIKVQKHRLLPGAADGSDLKD